MVAQGRKKEGRGGLTAHATRALEVLAEPQCRLAGWIAPAHEQPHAAAAAGFGGAYERSRTAASSALYPSSMPGRRGWRPRSQSTLRGWQGRESGWCWLDCLGRLKAAPRWQGALKGLAGAARMGGRAGGWAGIEMRAAGRRPPLWPARRASARAPPHLCAQPKPEKTTALTPWPGNVESPTQ